MGCRARRGRGCGTGKKEPPLLSCPVLSRPVLSQWLNTLCLGPPDPTAALARLWLFRGSFQEDSSVWPCSARRTEEEELLVHVM